MLFAARGNEESAIFQLDDCWVSLLRDLKARGRYRLSTQVGNKDTVVFEAAVHRPDLALIPSSNVLAILPTAFAVGTLQVHGGGCDG